MNIAIIFMNTKYYECLGTDLADKIAKNSLSHHPNTQKILAEERIIGTSHRELSEYAGRYILIVVLLW
jgi:hypothetical protein